MERPLLVTDRGLAALEFVAVARQLLADAGKGEAFFSEVDGNPGGRHVESGLKVYRENHCDGVIGLGGGSALDTAKTIGLIADQSLSLWQLEDNGDNWKLADSSRIPPVIAIPTTAGTGSEVGRAAVILDEQARSKKIIFHPAMLPAVVISDPELSRGLPPDITAWTGMDALVHAIEAFCAPAYHPMADGIAVEAVRMILKWLPRAVTQGDDLEARGHMLVAASMGATAFQKGLGSIHSVAHVLGALYDTHHGLTNAVLMPYGLTQNANHIEEHSARLCAVVGIDGNDTAALVDYLIDFRSELGIPHTLAELGIGIDDASEIGRRAVVDPTAASNAMPVSAEDLEALFLAARQGDISQL
jgi:alcohol dehydrogenase class IV